VLGLFFVIIGAFINQLFDIRQPKIAVEANVAQLLICMSLLAGHEFKLMISPTWKSLGSMDARLRRHSVRPANQSQP
jgi:hypothetical protein